MIAVAAIVSLAACIIAGINAHRAVLESRAVRDLLDTEARIRVLDASVAEAVKLLQEERRDIDRRWTAYEARSLKTDQQVAGLLMKVRG